MKNFKDYIKEESVSPCNTIGMGNPSLPTAEEPGTEQICTAKCKKEKRKKYLNKNICV